MEATNTTAATAKFTEAITRAAEIMGTMVNNGATVDEAIAACEELHPGLGRIARTFGPAMKQVVA